MYNIGEVSKYLGISRDTLKFYESKGLINTKKNSGNGYREYDHFDMYDITTINFYREIDIEMKKNSIDKEKYEYRGFRVFTTRKRTRYIR